MLEFRTTNWLFVAAAYGFSFTSTYFMGSGNWQVGLVPLILSMACVFGAVKV